MLYSSSNSEASHNKDYSVVQTFSASPTCGAFLFPLFSRIKHKKDDQAMPDRLEASHN